MSYFTKHLWCTMFMAAVSVCCLPVIGSAQDIEVDDVEDGNLANDLGQTWSVFEGNGTGNTGGNLLITGTAMGLGGSTNAIAATGQLPPVVGGFNYGGVQCPLGGLNVSLTTILEFDVLVTSGGPYKVRIEDGAQTFNSAFINLNLAAGVETHVKIPLADFAAGGDGGNPINFGAATTLVWDLQTAADSAPFGITIDNVKFTDPILVERAEDGDITNELSEVWFVFEGNGATDPSFGNLTLSPTTPGLGSSDGAITVAGNLPPLVTYNYGGVGTPLGSLDISNSVNLEFDITVNSGGPFKVRVEDSFQTFNSAFVNLSVTPGVPTHVIIPLDRLIIGGAGSPDGGNRIDPTIASQIVWDLQTSGDSSPFGITIDNIYFTGQGTPPPTPTPVPPLPADEDVLVDDLEDGDFVSEFGGDWEAFNGNASCPSPCGTILTSTACTPLSGAYSFCVSGAMPPLDGFVFGGVNVRLGPSSTDSINVSNHLALEFDIRVTQGGPYRVRLEDAAHVAAGFTGYLQPHVNINVTPNQTQRVSIPLEFFTFGPDGMDLSEVAAIVWVPQTDIGGDPFGMVIDNVVFKGTGVVSEVENWSLFE